MHEIKIICPSCKFEHPWEHADLDSIVCAPGKCDNCWTSFLVVFHPEACMFRHCGIMCAQHLSSHKIPKITEFQAREIRIPSATQILRDVLDRVDLARVAKACGKKAG